MNINLLRLKPVIRQLSGIRQALERLADCYEADLADRDIYPKPPKSQTSGPEPTVGYTEEDMDWAKENIERLKREEEFKDAEET